MHDAEATWIAQAQKGNSQAFGSLVEHYQRPVYNLCYRMLGNAEDAEDAAQEAFFRSYKAICSYDRTRAFSSWLLSIAAHYCIDQLRLRRFQVVSVEDLPYQEIPASEPMIETGLSFKEEQAVIRSLLDQLGPIDRAVVVMYYWYDFSYEEISKSLNLTQSAIKSRLHRARRAMAESWAKKQSREAEGALSDERLIMERTTP